jgi:hypothetical protein
VGGGRVEFGADADRLIGGSRLTAHGSRLTAGRDC